MAGQGRPTRGERAASRRRPVRSESPERTRLLPDSAGVRRTSPPVTEVLSPLREVDGVAQGLTGSGTRGDRSEVEHVERCPQGAHPLESDCHVAGSPRWWRKVGPVCSLRSRWPRMSLTLRASKLHTATVFH